jgi:tRNA pseudouridine38-40 synthase
MLKNKQMPRYKAQIEYCGSNYFGMQKQENLPTIQASLELAISQFTNGKTTEIDYCGRTDAGVHAFSQVIHFNLAETTPEKLMPEMQICQGINFYLKKNKDFIAVKSCNEVDENFHSRFSCKSREYKYYIYNNPFPSPIFKANMHHETRPLNIEKMQEIANMLIGTHDFSSFRGKRCEAKSPIKTLHFLNISTIAPNIIEIHVCAQSFLYKMVRNITGLLIAAGKGKVDEKSAIEIIEARDISKLPYSAPAHGLYFWNANY